MSYDNNNHQDHSNDGLYAKRLKAGKRRTYFFDVRTTRANDFFLTITESKKRFDDKGYERHKIFLYKEDFNKFLNALGEAIDHVKTELLPDFDFDQFNHDEDYQPDARVQSPDASEKTEEVDGAENVSTESNTGTNDRTDDYSQPEATSAEPIEAPSANEKVDKW